MSILPIRITGEPVLHRAAAPVESFDSELHDLVADMIETMHAAPGVGLAAPQVGVGSQVFVWRYGGAGSFDSHYRDVLHMVRESEGCLSVPGYGYPLRRALGAVLRGYDIGGNAIEVSARGWLARIFQHEYDHLQGTLYVDRLEAPYADEAQRVIAERGWGASGYTWTPGERA